MTMWFFRRSFVDQMSNLPIKLFGCLNKRLDAHFLSAASSSYFQKHMCRC